MIAGGGKDCAQVFCCQHFLGGVVDLEAGVVGVDGDLRPTLRCE
jgi:hypothetical protein